jgi:hypothetical protein
MWAELRRRQMRFRAKPSDVVVNILGLAALEYGGGGRYGLFRFGISFLLVYERFLTPNAVQYDGVAHIAQCRGW